MTILYVLYSACFCCTIDRGWSQGYSYQRPASWHPIKRKNAATSDKGPTRRNQRDTTKHTFTMQAITATVKRMQRLRKWDALCINPGRQVLLLIDRWTSPAIRKAHAASVLEVLLLGSQRPNSPIYKHGGVRQFFSLLQLEG